MSARRRFRSRPSRRPFRLASEGDTKSGLGIAGLVAAGIGIVAAKKLGLIAIVLVFAKKFLVIILAAFAGVGAKLRSLFRRKSAEEEAVDYGTSPDAAMTADGSPGPGKEPALEPEANRP